MRSLPYLFFAMLFLLTSCAIKNDYASFSYPTSYSHTEPRTTLQLTIADARERPDVGYIKNGLGMKMARILPKTPVSSILSNSITDALAEYGISIGESPFTLSITIEECFAHYTTGLLITRAKAKMTLSLQLLDIQGTVLYKQVIHGEGVESPVFFYSGKNTGKALSKALTQALNTLCKDLIPHLTTQKSPL